MAIGKCLRCDAIGKVTEDHVVPQWLKKVLPNLGISIKEWPEGNNTEIVCEKCNSTKGGNIDFSFIQCRELLKKVIVKWTEEIRKHEEFNL